MFWNSQEVYIKSRFFKLHWLWIKFGCHIEIVLGSCIKFFFLVSDRNLEQFAPVLNMQYFEEISGWLYTIVPIYIIQILMNHCIIILSVFDEILICRHSCPMENKFSTFLGIIALLNWSRSHDMVVHIVMFKLWINFSFKRYVGLFSFSAPRIT